VTTARRCAALALGQDGALGLVSLVVGVGLGRLTTAPTGLRTLAATATVALAGHVTAGAVARLGTTRRGPWRVLAALSGAAAVALVCTWWFAPGATVLGVPAPSAFARLGHDVAAAVSLSRHRPTPLPASTPVLLCVSAGAGLVAVLARVLAVGRRRPGRVSWPALVPPSALFLYTAVLCSRVERAGAAAAFAGALVVLVWSTAGTGERRPLRAWAPPALSVTAVVGVALALSPTFDAMEVHVLASGSGASGALVASQPLGALALIDDLHGVLTGRGTDQLFEARSPVPTYWQLATLTTFDGTRFTPDRATVAAATGAAVAPPATATQPASVTGLGDGGLSTSVVVLALQSRLLPVPPGTTTVTGDLRSSFVPGVGAVRATLTSNGLIYQVSGAAPPSSLPAGDDSPPPAALAADLAVPAVSPAVRSLARALVRGRRGPGAKAAALAAWFRSGRFRYTLHPRLGADALDSFLFSAHEGFCQQFAAAYTVLARIDGLPTRVAVGFTAGAIGPDGDYAVTGADAHVWPEVYLGRAAGWVSFEPTPALAPGEDAAGVFSGGSSVPAARADAAPRGGQQAPAGASTAAPAPSTVPSGASRGAGAGRRGAGVLVGALAFGALLGVGVLGALALSRRRRSRPSARHHHGGPGAQVLRQWGETNRALRARALGKGPAETLGEHARRLQRDAPASVAEPYAALAELVSRAAYDAAPVDAGDVDEARRLRAAVRAGR
jgi:transglutaminase-like putative cysteine protease